MPKSLTSTYRRLKKLPGVKAIVTGADCDKGFGVLPIARTEHPLARERVRYCGEPVAAVAAIDDATAKEALKRIKLKVRELPAYTPRGRRWRPMPSICISTGRTISSAMFF